MKKNFYKTMYRLLAGATRRVNWRWLNEWKVAMGISLIAAGCVGAGKKLAPEKGNAEKMIATLQEIKEQQEKRAMEERDGMTCYVIIENMPEFSTGNYSAYCRRYLRYPAEGLKDGVTGKVYIQFLIEKDGSVSHAKIIRGVHPALDSAALTFISELPPFLPATQRGKAVQMSFTLPVEFTAEMREETREKLDMIYHGIRDNSDSWETLKYYILEHVQYPKEALTQGMKDTVYIKLHLAQDGNISQEKIVRGKYPLLNEEVLRVAREIPKWEPARANGKPVSESYIIGIPFNLKTLSAKSDNTVYLLVEDMPKFPGGNEEMYIAQHLQYPPEAKAQGIEGKVYVQFVVERDGSINNAKIGLGAHLLLDEEALRIVQRMPHWIPGRHKEKAVRVSCILPINFKLD